jgi:hypothetical protein
MSNNKCTDKFKTTIKVQMKLDKACQSSLSFSYGIYRGAPLGFREIEMKANTVGCSAIDLDCSFSMTF